MILSHPSEIINYYLEELKNDYDLENGEFTILIEKRLAYCDFNIMPDIQIIKDAQVVCVVEIGYTRANKIKIYGELKIADIRWVEYGSKDYLPMVKMQDILSKHDNNPLGKIHISIFMGGHIRTLQKCPTCGKKFSKDLICNKCHTKPTKFFIDIWYRKRVKIYSDSRGFPLETYGQAMQTLMAIRHQITLGIFNAGNWKGNRRVSAISIR